MKYLFSCVYQDNLNHFDKAVFFMFHDSIFEKMFEFLFFIIMIMMIIIIILVLKSLFLVGVCVFNPLINKPFLLGISSSESKDLGVVVVCYFS